MKLAALFSGGKDSTYAIHLAKKLSHSVDVLLTLFIVKLVFCFSKISTK